MEQAIWKGAVRSIALILAAITLPSPAAGPAEAQPATVSLHPCEKKGFSAATYAPEKGDKLPAAIPLPLTDTAGVIERGRDVFVDRARGNCLACHQVATTELSEARRPEGNKPASAQGNLGPPLDGIAARYTEGELRLIIADPLEAFPDGDVAMPAYHNIDALTDVDPRCEGRPVLSAQEVEDVLAFLMSLK